MLKTRMKRPELELELEHEWKAGFWTAGEKEKEIIDVKAENALKLMGIHVVVKTMCFKCVWQ